MAVAGHALPRDHQTVAGRWRGDEANPVYCGGNTYYDGCESAGSSCTETCSRYPEEAAYSGYNKCELIYTKGTTKTGYTYHHTKCDQVCSNYSYAYFSSCTGEQTDKDCTGNPTVAAGMRICPSDYELVGRTVQCGGNTYAEACRQKCNYDETEASCLAQGLCFIERCRNEANQIFGECTNC